MDPLSPQDLDLATRTVLSEAGVDGDPGMIAVANVIKNRVASGQYGATPSDVVTAPNQFSAWQLPKTDPNNPSRISAQSPQYQRASQIVGSVFTNQIADNTGGADHYLNPSLVKTMPGWAQGTPTAKVGSQSFYASPQATPDLLGSWGASAPASNVAPAAATPDAQPDLLGSWGNTEPDVTTGAQSPLRITIHPQNYAPAPGQQPTPAQQANETLAAHQGTSLTDAMIRLGIGAERGVGDVADTIAQGIAATGTAGAGALHQIGVISPQTNATVQNWGQSVDQRVAAARDTWNAISQNSPLAQIGRVGGEVAGTAPLLAAGAAALPEAITSGVEALPAALRYAATGAGYGGASAALTSASYDQPASQQIETGALGGGVLGPFGYGASRIGAGISRGLFGAISPDTAQLAQTARDAYNIPVDAGQVSANPMMRFADSVLQRLPFSGYGARTQVQRASFNRAVSNTFGENADAITPQVIENAEDRIGNVFDSVASRTPTIQADAPFYGRLGQTLDDARSVLPASEVAPLENQMRDMLSTIDPQTHTFTGETYQALTRKGAPLDRAIHSADPNIRFYATQMREALDEAMQRSAPPDAVQDLLQARSQWKALKTISPLADKAPTGDISPALVQSAANKSYTQNRNSDLRQLGRIGQRFLKEPPSSGTSERLLAMGLGGGALGAIGYGDYKFDPDNFQRNLALGGAALLAGRGASAALRSGWLSNALIRSGLPHAAPTYPIANLLSRAAPAAALTYRNAEGLTAQ